MRGGIKLMDDVRNLSDGLFTGARPVKPAAFSFGG
jgi:hypothetical protein